MHPALNPELAESAPSSATTHLQQLPATNGLHVRLTPVRNGFVIVFLSGWLLLWGLTEWSVFTFFLEGWRSPSRWATGQLLIGVLLLLWTAGGLIAIRALLWQVLGHEQLRLQGTTLTLTQDYGLFRVWQAYKTQYIHGVATCPAIHGTSAPDHHKYQYVLGPCPGSLCFRYGSKAVRFGAGLAEADAQWLLTELYQSAHTPDQPLS